MMPTFESNTLSCIYHQSISILCKDKNKGAPLFNVSTTIYIVVSSPPYFMYYSPVILYNKKRWLHIMRYRKECYFSHPQVFSPI